MKINRYRNNFEGFFRDVPDRSPGKTLVAGARAEIYQIAAATAMTGIVFSMRAMISMPLQVTRMPPDGSIQAFFSGSFPADRPADFFSRMRNFARIFQTVSGKSNQVRPDSRHRMLFLPSFC